jgi:hypothetical protein
VVVVKKEEKTKMHKRQTEVKIKENKQTTTNTQTVSLLTKSRRVKKDPGWRRNEREMRTR